MEIEGEEEYEVERILKKRMTAGGVTEYLIRWKGYGEADDTWEPEYNVEHAQEAIAQFKENVQTRPRRRKV